MFSLRSKSGHDEIVSTSEIQMIAMAHVSSLGAYNVHIYPLFRAMATSVCVG
jgi:hypothetical protein